jgi:ribosomal protein L16 Arg81 hydroxylase
MLSLNYLVNPADENTFFAQYYEQRSLVSVRRNAAYFANLITLDAIDRVLSGNTGSLKISLAQSGELIPRSSYAWEDGSIDLSALLRVHAAGATIVVDEIDQSHLELAALCQALELQLSARLQANVYVTPPHARGLGPHFDTHDVFVLQVHGSKHWRLYEGIVKSPIPAQGQTGESELTGRLLEEFPLQAGDSLYIPRGLIHEAIATDQASAHITIGVLSYTWADVIQEAVTEVVLKDVEFRKSLPRNFANSGRGSDAIEAKFADLLRRLAMQAKCSHALSAIRAEFNVARQRSLRGQLTQLAALSELSLASVVAPREMLAYDLTENESAVVITCYSADICVPKLGAQAVRFALSSSRFRIGELPGSLDDESKLVLVRRLIREGLIVAVSDG